MQRGQFFKRITLLLAIMLSLGKTAGAQSVSCTCNCLKPLFDYLISSHNLFIQSTDNTKLIFIIQEARKVGYSIDYRHCALLYRNLDKPFYAVTADSVSTLYKARIGDCSVALKSVNTTSRNFYKLQSKACGTDEKVTYANDQSAGATVAELKVDSCYSCTVATSTLCVSAIAENPVNTYKYGITGNWRPAKSYVYYASRAETNPALSTDIRNNGTFGNFAPFWAVQANKLTPQYDTTKWVWNTTSTLFNKRGFEIENKDPLGRYNAGLYGYDNTLPVAVIQNSRYRESAFDGFEDYGFESNICDTACAVARSFDFSGYKNSIDSTQRHTGKYSIKVSGQIISVSASLVTADNNTFNLSVNTKASPCFGYEQLMQSMNADANTILPSFSPLAGKTVLVSAWVKEVQDCSVPSYTGSQIGIVITRPGSPDESIIARPGGNIIEGWQRIEQVIALPADATQLSVNLQATGSAAVYFDDIRIHPYNANMKSFVYNPTNLRLVAELDENNYATFYEYDDEGTLIRLKKETERGVKTIKETRSALFKD